MIAKKELMAGLKVDVRKYLDASMLVRINSFLSLLKELR